MSHRIYVACLASYNNGVLHGRWIDLDDSDLDGVPDIIRYHIDYEGIARDFRLGGDVCYVELGGKTYVFSNS